MEFRTDLLADHGPDYAGKLLEYAYTRELARQIVKILQYRGYDAELLVPEEDDIPLTERVRRTNAHCQALGKSNVILISIHVNAAGNGTRWHTVSLRRNAYCSLD